MLGWTPFIDPIPGVGAWWWLLIIPLAWGIAMIYKAMRLPALDRYWNQVIIMTVQVVLGMASLAVCVIVFIQVIVPMLPAE